MVIFAYIAMLIFDFAVMAGTAWLVQEFHWSAWWFVLAVVLCAGSTPTVLKGKV